MAESIEAVSDALKALPRIKAGTLEVLALQKYSAVGLMKELLYPLKYTRAALYSADDAPK